MNTIQFDLGLLRHCSGHHDRARIANAARKRGHCVSADLTKAFRRSAIKKAIQDGFDVPGAKLVQGVGLMIK